MLRTIAALAVGLFLGWSNVSAGDGAVVGDEIEHGGGLNKCGCHVNHKTGDCHCHQDLGCGCACQPAHCV
jgi:hypothetical protein